MHHFQSCDQPRTEGKGNKLDKPDSDIHKQWRKSSTKVTSQFQMAAEVPERRYPSAAQAGLKLLASSDPLTSASQNVGITGVSHYASPHCLSEAFWAGTICFQDGQLAEKSACISLLSLASVLTLLMEAAVSSRILCVLCFPAPNCRTCPVCCFWWCRAFQN
ncbi:uncharacterized protein isoform X1 [Macaca fascicularis]|uniref:uncharacterized protein isoform X1 n=1 Tax=Macaca fascicularis TaxID=9541 RepID=UPI0032B061F6